MHSKGNSKQDEKIALRMVENNSKWDNWERINFQNIQATQKAQYQKNKQPNQKVGKRPFHLYLMEISIRLSLCQKCYVILCFPFVFSVHPLLLSSMVYKTKTKTFIGCHFSSNYCFALRRYVFMYKCVCVCMYVCLFQVL